MNERPDWEDVPVRGGQVWLTTRRTRPGVYLVLGSTERGGAGEPVTWATAKLCQRGQGVWEAWVVNEGVPRRATSFRGAHKRVIEAVKERVPRVG